MRLERKLAKKLKVKNGNLGGLDDDINLLLEGIPSVLDSMEGVDVVAEILENGESSKQHKQSALDEEVQSQMESGSVDGDSDSSPSSSVLDKAEEVIGPKGSRRVKKRTRKTNFEEFLDMEEMQSGVLAANADVELERRLAKKLKVKQGKLYGDDDEINSLFMDIPSVLDSLEDPGNRGAEADPVKRLGSDSLSRKVRTMKPPEQESAVSTIATTSGTAEQVKNDGSDVGVERVPKTAHALGSNTKYVAPHLRSLVQNESEEYAQIRKRVRGLLNRLSEANVESITREISTIFHDVGRSVGSQIIGHEVLASCSGGPRGNEQYAATFAAFVAGMACSVGIEFGAKLFATLAKYFEMEYLQEDNLSLRNLSLLLSYLYMFGVCTSELVYDFMIMLSKRLTEVDVSTILTILQTCGMKLRGHDPVGMKDFIHSVQQRVNELKASSGNGQANMSGKRMEFMLETVCDIKKNKKRPKEETVQHTRIKKWLQQYCLWDHYKELETMPLMRSMHLSKFTAKMVASFSVSLAILKVVDLSDPVQLTRCIYMFSSIVMKFWDCHMWLYLLV